MRNLVGIRFTSWGLAKISRMTGLCHAYVVELGWLRQFILIDTISCWVFLIF
jgi:hypothetical protein